MHKDLAMIGKKLGFKITTHFEVTEDNIDLHYAKATLETDHYTGQCAEEDALTELQNKLETIIRDIIRVNK